MLSIPDVAILGGLALLLFGPDRLPKIAREAGRVMRDLQNTSQEFIRELERAADTAAEEKETSFNALPETSEPAEQPPWLAEQSHEPEPDEPPQPRAAEPSHARIWPDS